MNIGGMDLSKRTLRVSVVLLATLGSTWAGLAVVSAHGQQHSRQVSGIVSSVGSGKLQLVTSAGSMTVATSTSTRVTRLVAGSTADLTPNLHVELRSAAGTTTVTTIVIEANHGSTWAARPSAPKRLSTPSPRLSTTRVPKGVGTPNARTRPTVQKHETDGQVVKVTSSSVTLRGERGQTSTYGLGSKVTVTKVMSGKLSDVATGEGVNVAVGANNLALSITITNS
jgi:hypothetical protein